MNELKEIIKKAVHDHVHGNCLPNDFVDQYYDVLIRRGYEEKTFEDLLEKCKTDGARNVILNTFYHHTMDFITELLDTLEGQGDEEEDEYL